MVHRTISSADGGPLFTVRGSDKMDYKSRFAPLEALGPNGWDRLEP